MRTATWGEYIPSATQGAPTDATKAIHPECVYSIVDVATNTTTVSSIPALLYGVYVNTALSAHTLLIQDATTASMSVSGATSANPIEITTSVNHGLVTGQWVTFLSMPGDFATPLNGLNFEIIKTAVNKFTVNVNGVGFAAYTSGGTVVGATTVAIIPASAPAGSMYTFPGFRFETSLVVNPSDAATGGVAIAYRPL